MPTLPGPPSSSAPWKQEPVKGEPERRERKQTESEKSLELGALFGLAEPAPGPLTAALHMDSTGAPHTCTHTHTHKHTHIHISTHT